LAATACDFSQNIVGKIRLSHEVRPARDRKNSWNVFYEIF